MIKLSMIKPGEGMSLDEMIKIVRDVDPKSWTRYEGNNQEMPAEFVLTSVMGVRGTDDFWFSYDYGAKSGDLDIYLSNNLGGSNWHRYHALRIMKGDLTLGFSGRLKESENIELKGLCLHIEGIIGDN